MTETNLRPFSAAAFNLFIAEHQLMGSRCAGCGAIHLPPRAICPHCHADQMEWVRLSGKGKLAGYTVIYIGPNFMVEQGFDRKNPYVSGVVELEEGPMISARITGVDATQPESIQVGAPVELDIIDFGEGDQKKSYLAFKVL